MNKGYLLIICIIFCTAFCVKADVIGMKTGASVGEKISVAFNPGVDATITWGNGRVERVVFDGTPAEITVKSDTFTIRSLQSITEVCVPGCKLISLNPEGAGDNLIRLYCQNNLLESLDLRKNTALRELNCEDNRLGALDVKPCASLTFLNCALNKLVVLDLGALSGINTLVCADNDMEELDVTGQTGLAQLWCQGNNIGKLSLNVHAGLQGVFAFANGLQKIDFGGVSKLREVWLDSNELTAIDLSGAPDVESLSIDHNNLGQVKLNGSNKKAMKFFYAHYNSLFFNSFPSIYNKAESRYTMKAVLSAQESYVALDKVQVDKPSDFAPFFASNAWGVKHNPVPVWKTSGGIALRDGIDYTAGLNNVYTFHKTFDGVYAEVTLPEYPGVTLRTAGFVVYNGADGVQSAESEESLNMKVTKGALQVVTGYPKSVKIYSVAGVNIDSRIVDGSYVWSLPSGIYIVNAVKVVIP